jgi:hypothetical protein
MTDASKLDNAPRTNYLAYVRRERPTFADQLADVDLVLAALLDRPSLASSDGLEGARAAYVEHLRRTYATLDGQLADLAVACGELFAPTIPLNSAAGAPAAHSVTAGSA